MQQIIVIIIIAAAVTLAIRSIIKTMKSDGNTCNGCAQCNKKTKNEPCCDKK